MFVVYFQVTVDHPQAAFVDASTSTLAAASTAGHSTAAAKSTEPSTSAPQPQQVLIHQSKTAAPAHSKVDRHHVDVRPITAISDVYMGTGMGGTVQGHLSSGASKFPYSPRICFFPGERELMDGMIYRPHRDDHRDGLRWFPSPDDQLGSGARPCR